MITLLGVFLGAPISAMEVNDADNAVFDLYFFGNGESGMFGTATGNQWIDAAKQTSGTVADSTTYYWTDELKQAMLNAVKETVPTPRGTASAPTLSSENDPSPIPCI